MRFHWVRTELHRYDRTWTVFFDDAASHLTLCVGGFATRTEASLFKLADLLVNSEAIPVREDVDPNPDSDRALEPDQRGDPV